MGEHLMAIPKKKKIPKNLHLFLKCSKRCVISKMSCKEKIKEIRICVADN